MLNIITQTLALLHSNDEWKARYDGYLNDIWNNPSKRSKGFRTPAGLSVYTTIGTRNTPIYFLRFKGQNVGEVRVTKNGIELTSKAKSEDFKKCPLSTTNKVKWHSKEASEFRKFFLDLSRKENDIHTHSEEHHVENALLKEFRKSKSIEKALSNIQPVLLHGNFFQMPTPLKASTHQPSYSESKGGGIDILARIKAKNGHTRLCIIEIKDENENKETQKQAMSQAVTYATFIAALLQDQPEWMEFFNAHTSQMGLSRNTDKHDLEVVTIMPMGTTETFEDEKIKIPGESPFTLHCHSLYYDKQIFDTTSKFVFSGTFLQEIKSIN